MSAAIHYATGRRKTASARVYLSKGKGKNVIQTEKDLKRVFPKKYWNKLHLQIIWYGREYCKARDCYGITCKICKSCYPNRKKPIKTKKA